MEKHDAAYRLGLPVQSGAVAAKIAVVPLFLFEMVYRILLYFLFTPLMKFILNTLIGINGDSLAFNNEIWHFVLSVPGIIAIFTLVPLAMLLVYFEFAVIISIVRQTMANKTPKISEAIVQAISSFGSLKSPATLLFCLYALLLLPLVHIGVTSSLIPRYEIPPFIIGELTKTDIGQWGVVAARVILVILHFCLLFVLPAMVIDGSRFTAAVKKSFSTLRAYKWRALGIILLICLVWVIFFLLPRQMLQTYFGTADIHLTGVIGRYGLLSPRALLLLLGWLVAEFLLTLHAPAAVALLVAFYLPLGEHPLPSDERLAKIRAGFDFVTGWLQRALASVGMLIRRLTRWIMARPLIRKYRKLLAIVLVVALLFALQSGLSVKGAIYGPVIIGHRGSAYGIENSMQAIESAISMGTDFVEVDILLSKDNIPMVIHDTNLQRLSGQNVNVYDLTAQQLQAIPLSGGGMTANIPTLQQVVDACEGRIHLAIEFKFHGREQVDAVQQVMDIIKTSEYQSGCLFVSLDYDTIARLKAQYPEYLAGYCVYGDVGALTLSNLYDLNVDFLLIEEAMVRDDFIRLCWNANLPVYVWTVNDESKMNEYLDAGVSGLVTDYPDVGVTVLQDRGEYEDREGPYEYRENSERWGNFTIST